ncbi:Calcium uniporter protein 4 [Cardamine amara subsp. amara]|uniref:Calcium uniporter protein 4 n=1 Tax=Cardamine amara subsp. amara TaxID=228776 RepID=A0ABD0ZVX5_CARAN
MALRRAITKRLIDTYRSSGTQQHSKFRQFSSPVTKIVRPYMTSPNLTDQIVGIRIESVSPPRRKETAVKGLSVTETKKLLRIYQTEKVKAKLREITKSSVSYWEFIQICCESCGNDEQGSQIANALDHSGCVVVLGDIVFLHPHQIAKSMEAMINQASAIPNDPRKEELVKLEDTKKFIDIKAKRIVKTELYCGLGFLAVQTIGLMRLTFWELSWDVMEPICFFVTSLHFLLGYFFFLRTSTEPSFEGFFRQRFKTKQKKLMEMHRFDFVRYTELNSLFRPLPCKSYAPPV